MKVNYTVITHDFLPTGNLVPSCHPPRQNGQQSTIAYSGQFCASC